VLRYKVPSILHVVLWLQGSICTLWSCVCLGIVYYLHASLNSNAQHLLVMFFQPFVPPLLMAWLWLINVRHWELSKIEYETCFSSRDRKLLPAHTDLYKVRGLAYEPGAGAAPAPAPGMLQLAFTQQLASGQCG
jgi:hypothetical protein